MCCSTLAARSASPTAFAGFTTPPMDVLASALRCRRCGCTLPGGSLLAAPFCCRSRPCRGADPSLLRIGLLAAETGGAASRSARSAAVPCGVPAVSKSAVPMLRPLADPNLPL